MVSQPDGSRGKNQQSNSERVRARATAGMPSGSAANARVWLALVAIGLCLPGLSGQGIRRLDPSALGGLDLSDEEMDAFDEGFDDEVYGDGIDNEAPTPAQEQCTGPPGSCGSRSSQPTLAVVSIMEGPLKNQKWSRLARRNHERYCSENGYHYELWTGYSESNGRTPHWEKLRAALDLFDRGFEIVFWMDADSVFTNFDLKLESLIDSDKDFAFSGDWNIINSGHWLVRNTAFGRNFIKEVQSMYPMPFPNWDNGAFSIRIGGCRARDRSRWAVCLRHVDQGFHNRETRRRVEQGEAADLIAPDLREKLQLVPKRAMNGYPGDWVPGDFILHTVDRKEWERNWWNDLVLRPNGTPRPKTFFSRESVATLHEKAAALMKDRNYDEAIKLYHLALLAGSVDSGAGQMEKNVYVATNFNMGIAFLQNRRPWKAVNSFQRGVDREPEDAQGWVLLANGYLSMTSRFYQNYQYPLAMAAIERAADLVAQQVGEPRPVVNDPSLCEAGTKCEVADLKLRMPFAGAGSAASNTGNGDDDDDDDEYYDDGDGEDVYDEDEYYDDESEFEEGSQGQGQSDRDEYDEDDDAFDNY